MFAYWLMFMGPALAALGHDVRQRSQNINWVMLGIAFILFIGFRYHVGGDWYNYLRRFELISIQPLGDVLLSSDPGYGYLNWLMGQWGWGINGVNLFCGAVFITGLIAFCKQQPNPWLAFTVAVPYILYVIAIGYTRQGIALGFFFLAIASIERKVWRILVALLNTFLFIIAATLFHKTALLLLGFGLLLFAQNRMFKVVAVLVVGFALWDSLVAEYQETLWNAYVDQQMISQGAKIRVAMNFLPAVILLLFRKQWKIYFKNYLFWLVMALGSIAAVLLVNYASTAVDRVSLYFTPIQVVVLSRLPFLARHHVDSKVLTFVIVSGYAAVLFVWFTYATHARYWLPYHNWLLM